MKVARNKSVVAVALTTGLMLVGGLVWGLSASFGASGAPTPAPGKVVLKIGLQSMPDNLNPLMGYENSAYEVWNLNYDLLFDYAPDGSVRPGVVESWSTSADRLTWILKIRHGVQWQDGQPLTAKDVAWTLNMLVKTHLATYATEVKLITDAVATDDYTCEVHCSKPKADMTRAFVYILPQHIWSKIPNPDKYRMTYPIIGSGPFQCTKYKQGVYVELQKNPTYWGQKPAIDEILLDGYTNEDTMLQDFKLGMIDAAYGIPAPEFTSVANMPGVQGYKANIWYFEYLCFNCYSAATSQGNPVLKDVKFRQALNWAIDKDALVRIGLGGYGRPGSTMCPPGEFPANWDAHYTPTAAEAYGFDIAKANQLLDEAGYKDTNGDGIRDYQGQPIKLRLWARTQSTSSQLELKLIAGWLKKLDLDIELRVLDEGAVDQKLYSYTSSGAYAPDFDMYQWDSYGYADPGENLSGFTTEQIQNWNDACWSDKQYDRLATEQASEMDAQKRLDMLHQMQEIVYAQSPYVILTYPDSLSVVNTKKWEGWVPFLSGAPFLNGFNIDSYLKLTPKAASSAGSSYTTLWIAIGAVVVVAAIVVLVLSRRRKTRAVEE